MTQAQKTYLMKLKVSKERILKVNKSLKATSGIYMFWRTKEDGTGHSCYIGQSHNILRRCAEHLLGYQKIDLSIKKHGLFDPIKNKYGYYVKALEYCEPKFLDEKEKKYIRVYSEKPCVELKNITSGGQDKGRTNINEARPSKKYRDGLDQGKNNAIKEIAEIMKYLKIVPNQFKKNGEPTELAKRKLNEFKELLNGKNNNKLDS